ncbi:hypothetical protein L208DRAFT_1418354 [Tricholoma matsutake]|nr:hypothetical protein L208DRAFT_1418354 [Tricholoma matsutake 945]
MHAMVCHPLAAPTTGPLPAGIKDKENIDDVPGINFKAFEEYGLGKPAPPLTLPTIPWLPFSSESEFSFAEVILESAMSNTQVDKLIQVIHMLIECKETFSVKNHKELNNLWIGASDPLTLVCVMYDKF